MYYVVVVVVVVRIHIVQRYQMNSLTKFIWKS